MPQLLIWQINALFEKQVYIQLSLKWTRKKKIPGPVHACNREKKLI